MPMPRPFFAFEDENSSYDFEMVDVEGTYNDQLAMSDQQLADIRDLWRQQRADNPEWFELDRSNAVEHALHECAAAARGV